MTHDDRRPTQEASASLGTASRAATGMAYVIALVGTAGGTLSLRDGDLATALIVWTTSLAVAAVLGGMSTLLRAVLDLTRRIIALERRLDRTQDA